MLLELKTKGMNLTGLVL